MTAMWMDVIRRLQEGHKETRRWLDTGEHSFLFWCDWSNKDPEVWREQLLRVWDLGQSESSRSLPRRSAKR